MDKWNILCICWWCKLFMHICYRENVLYQD